MIELSVKVDIDGAMRHLDDLQKKKLPTATQRALLKTAYDIRTAEQDEMRRVFDRPTRWTLGSMKVKTTSKFNILVGVTEPDGHYRRANYYLGTQISGGTRNTKAFERALQRAVWMPRGWYAVPGEKAKLDAYGNMGPGEIKQIMSWFGAAEPYAGSTQNMTPETRAKRRAGTKKKRGFEYFSIMPGRGGRSQYLTPGIYRRTTFGFGKAIDPILIFVKSARYQRRFDFFKVASRVKDRVWQGHFNDAIRRDVV